MIDLSKIPPKRIHTPTIKRYKRWGSKKGDQKLLLCAKWNPEYIKFVQAAIVSEKLTIKKARDVFRIGTYTVIMCRDYIKS